MLSISMPQVYWCIAGPLAVLPRTLLLVGNLFPPEGIVWVLFCEPGENIARLIFYKQNY